MTNGFLAVLIALGLTACANSPQMRTLATQTSTRVTIQEASLNDFVAANKQLNSDDANAVNVMRTEAANARSNTNLEVQAWKLGGRRDLIDAQAAATQAQSADIIASLATVQLKPPSLDDGGAAAQLDSANTAFVAMAKKPTAWESLKEIYSSADAVYQALEALKQAAAKAAPAAAAKPATPAAAVVAAATPTKP